MRAARWLSVLLLAACGARPPAPPPSAVRVSERHPAAAAVAPAAAVTTNEAPPPASSELVPVPATAAVPSEAVPRVTPEPHVLLEPAYSALGHPRLATEMLTLGRDEELFQWALGGSSDPSHPANRPGYHPATRVVIDVELLSRAPQGTTRRLLAIARSTGYWPLRSCFETAQRVTTKAERTARVRLTLSAGGRVLGARSFKTESEPSYARCVLERTRHLDFSPGFTRKLDVELKLKQWPGSAPVPPRAPESEPSLKLPPEDAAAFEGVAPALSECYGSALQGDAQLWGRLALKLRVKDGNVLEAEQVETRFPSDALVACARQAVLGARLPTSTVDQLTFAVRFGEPPQPPPAPADPGAPPASAPPAPGVPP